VEELKAQLIILDDGFQHRRLKRDLDIVLLKEKDLKDRLLPFGRLREPLSGLKRAHAIVLTYQDLKEWEFKIEKPTFKLYRKNWRVVSGGGEILDFKDKSFIAFCGLGDNEQFFKTLERLGIKTEEKLSFPDHYHYEGFKLQKGKLYITTLKDFFKLEPAENLYYLDFDVEVPGLIDFVKKSSLRGHRAELFGGAQYHKDVSRQDFFISHRVDDEVFSPFYGKDAHAKTLSNVQLSQCLA
jgi:tetraacyldisaccharide 4'-kinase